jgi:hypothetical protein
MKVQIQICGGDATKVLFQLSIAMEEARNWRKQTGGQLVEVIRVQVGQGPKQNLSKQKWLSLLDFNR